MANNQFIADCAVAVICSDKETAEDRKQNRKKDGTAKKTILKQNCVSGTLLHIKHNW